MNVGFRAFLNAVTARTRQDPDLSPGEVSAFIETTLGIERDEDIIWFYVDDKIPEGYEPQGAFNAAALTPSGTIFDFVFGKEYRRVDSVMLTSIHRPLIVVQGGQTRFLMIGPEHVGALSLLGEGPKSSELLSEAQRFTRLWEQFSKASPGNPELRSEVKAENRKQRQRSP